ncbi:hypothetical protein D9758_005191 [Tetrapyrgos nigripes]|uniref:Cytochrome P450 n=1 Tax=Tetrapyrgos nigripes TaxID=182062 RepID=A0A8H5GWS5_9AGAR|nr:hypothetical protein D9758_005191 [Tetrapyrgos nigripes]
MGTLLWTSRPLPGLWKTIHDFEFTKSSPGSPRSAFGKVMAGELIGRNQSSILFTQYGPRLKECRQLLHGWINRNVIKNYAPLQEYGSYKIMARLLEKPEDFSEHIREVTGSIALKLTYGIQTKEKNDPFIEMSERLGDITTEATQPGKWLVDSFPIPSFPGASFKRWANDARSLCDTLVHTPFEKTVQDMASGSYFASWTANELLNSKPVNRDVLIMTSASIYNGSIATTVHVIRTFILMMIKYPEIQRRAQGEVDTIIGKDQLAGLKDIDSLPYVQRIIKEVLRINPVIPLVPHSLDEDDVYEGHTIPKGSWIMANLWEMAHDPSIYKDPYVFNPDRYDPEFGDQAEEDMSEFVFGFGRRSCPGIHFAKASLFIVISHLLSVFDILPTLDGKGKPVLPENDFDFGHLSCFTLTYAVLQTVYLVADIDNCQRFNIVTSVLFCLSTVAVTFLFLLRVYAIFHDNRIAKISFALLWLATVALSALDPVWLDGVPSSAIFSGPEYLSYRVCTYHNLDSKYRIVAALVMLLYDTGIYISISVRLFQFFTLQLGREKMGLREKARRFFRGDDLPVFSKALLRDGQLYYIFTGRKKPTMLSLLSIGLICVVVWILDAPRRRRRSSLPSGPTAIPLLGNLHQLPKVNPFETYAEWSKTYGPLFYFHVLGREFIIINSLKAAMDLFETRSHLYCHKPRMVMAGELVGKEQTSMVFSRYNDRLKECRKITHSWMGKVSIVETYSMQEIGIVRLLESLLDDPESFSEHIHTYAGTVLLRLIYGTRCLPKNDPHIALSEHVCGLTAEAMRPGRWFCDFLPWMAYIPAWLPGAGFKEWAKQTRKTTMELIQGPYETVRRSVLDGSAVKSWLADAMLDESGQVKDGEEGYNLMMASGSLYAAGIDTTVSAIRTFYLMMARNPEVQKKAQAEIDSVVGPNRLPNISDRPSLPYINAIIKECLRINSIVPILPHSSDTDDVYEGYLIPKGSFVMVNAWKILHDPEIYPEPETFRPERFIPSAGKKMQMDPEELAFGLGRRTCAGTYFAQSWLYLNVTQVLFAFNVGPAKGPDGKLSQVPPARFVTAGHIRVPADFKCSLTPRSADKVKLIRELATIVRDE